MWKFLQKFLLGLGLCAFAPLLFGFLVWMATARRADTYLLKSIQTNAAVTVWLNPATAESENDFLTPKKMTLSLWISPSKVSRALAHFDGWIQEYSLVRESTDEAAENESYALPPSVLPDPDEAEYFVEDPYDVALRALLEDFWNSGLFVVAGSIHFKTPFWMKPFVGWIGSGIQKNAPVHFFDSKLTFSGLREDGADFPSWFSELPFAHLGVESIDGLLVHETVFDIGGEQIAALHGRLCELGNVGENWCSLSDVFENPIEPVLYATEAFKAQFSVFWALRGEHLIWSNQRECLSVLAQGKNSERLSCGELPGEAGYPTVSFQEREILNTDSTKGAGMVAGFFLNQRAMRDSFESLASKVVAAPLDGATWLHDLIQGSTGGRLLKEWRSNLQGRALLLPSWGSRLNWLAPQTGQLSTFVHWFRGPGSGEQIEREWAESQFDFLYGLSAAWSGLPRGPGRLERTLPWQSQKSFWKADTVYSLGWSERE